MNIPKEELLNKDYGEGYRIIYFYDDNSYKIGAFCKTIEGFMLGFAKSSPIVFEEEIPPFISIEDLLQRYLNKLTNISKVALYKTDGTCLKLLKR